MILILAVVGLLTFDSVGRSLLVPAAFFGLNLLEAYLITPVVLGRRLMLNTVVIFVGLIFWGWMWGIPGAILAVPLLATFKILCDHIEPFRPVGEFLGR
jgi:predicted PurR-regulated permease PerM